VMALRQMDEQNEPPMKTIEHTPVAEFATGATAHVTSGSV
jgi:hypothetical protein